MPGGDLMRALGAMTALWALALAGCAGAGRPAPATTTASAPAAPPALIPIEELFASRDAAWWYRVSPDGARLAWITSHRGRATVHVRTLDAGDDDTRAIVTNPRRTLRSFIWARDSRHILYADDRDGDENTHVFRVSVVAPDDPPVDLTPVAGSRAWILRLLRADPAHVVIGWNARDRRVYDLYRVNVVTGAHTLLAENPGDVIGWAVDRHGRPLARVRHVGPDERVLEVQRDGAWRALQRLELEEFNLALLGPTPDDAGLWMLSGRGRDRRALVRLDLATGDERVVHEDPEVDVEDAVISGLTHRPLVALTYPDRQVIHFLDDALKMDLAPLRGVEGGSLALTSFSDDDQLVTVVVSTEKGSHNYLVDRRTRHTRLLGRSHILKRADALATTEPIAFRARDGVPLRGYLTRPAGSTRPGPLVLHVHGGHWARDYWGYDGAVQFLANRGYAVLQVNYRGSTGYGRAFRELAVRQYAGTMHDDLVDGVRWAVRAGVADPARVAIYGGSYGGYAAMVGMTFTPDVFACGVAFVGISNWLTYYERTPAYWEQAVLPLMHKYVGDPRRPEDRRHLEAISPLFRVQEVKGPMLLMHGAHDARVSVRESRQMAEALERAGKTVRLVVFEDEGHSRQYGNWRNAVRHYQEVEEFLAGCLGGRRTAR